MKRPIYTISAALLALSLALTGGGPAEAEPRDPAMVKLPEMTPALNLGKLNYEAKCAQCHGVNAAGTDKGPTFLHRVYHPGHHGDGAFFIAPKRGVRAHHWPYGNMPRVEGIADGQIKSIIAYVRALQKANGIFQIGSTTLRKTIMEQRIVRFWDRYIAPLSLLAVAVLWVAWPTLAHGPGGKGSPAFETYEKGQLPAAYKGQKNPLKHTEDTMTAGQRIYQESCCR